MTRCRTWTAIVALLIVATALALVATPQPAAASTPRDRLTHARHSLTTARHRLSDARAALNAALAATEATTTPPTPESPTTTLAPTPSATEAPDPAATVAVAATGPTISQLKARVVHWRQMVRRAKRTVKRLTRSWQLVVWERKGQWRSIIRVAAARYDVSADRMHRMMMRESGGRRFAGTTFKGLFQYHPGTWRASWNPWRHDSIYDGSSQIFATAYAIHRGYGASMWPNTY